MACHKSDLMQEFREQMPRSRNEPYVLCDPAQSKCTWAFHQSHFVSKIYNKIPIANTATPVLCEPAQAKCTWTCHKRYFVWTFTGKVPNVNPGAIVLCEPAQSTCAWTSQKSHFLWKFTGNMPNATDTPSIEHRALTVTVRTPQHRISVWGKAVLYVCPPHIYINQCIHPEPTETPTPLYPVIYQGQLQ